MICAIVSTMLMFAVHQNFHYKDKAIIAKGEAVAALDTTKVKLTEKQQADLTAMNSFKEEVSKEAKVKSMNKETAAVLGTYEELYKDRTDKVVRQEMRYSYYYIWDILMFMFFGMAFYKNGFLLGKSKTTTYLLVCLIGLGLGLTISYVNISALIKSGFNEYDFVKNNSFNLYDVSRLFRAFGFLGLVMLLYKSNWFKWFFELMRPVGQMAFTNYLLQSIIGMFYFYGIGFGMFGKLQRYETYIYVGVVWLFEIILSHIWLRYFRFGPFEWAWRSLTYWKLQPFVREKSVSKPEFSTA